MCPLNELTVRRASATDIPAVQRLAGIVWRAHYPGIISAEQIEYMLERGYAAQALAGFVQAPAGGIELAYAGGALVGFAAWAVEDDRAEAKLDKLYVDPGHQRTGIGGRLIAHVASRAREAGARTLVLNVNKRNIDAQAAYRKHGFTVREAVVVDIGGGFVMDDYVMARTL